MIPGHVIYSASSLAILFLFAVIKEGPMSWPRAAVLEAVWPMTLSYVAVRAFWSSRWDPAGRRRSG